MRSSLSRSGRGRAHVRPALALAACACLASVVPPWPARASDEDSSAQVYLVFDPETGEFVTSHDPNAALPTQTGLESRDARKSPSGSDRAEAGIAGNPVLMVAAVAVIVAGGAAFAFLRLRRRAH